MKLIKLLIAISISGFLFSCMKENELDERSLANSYENFFNGLPEYNLITFDSNTVTNFVTASEIRIYFHVDFSKIYDTSMIDKIIYTRNNLHGNLQHGEYGYLLNLVPVPLEAKYDYRFAFKFKGGDNLISAYTPVYTVIP